MNRVSLAVALTGLMFLPQLSWAGGFETPDNGTEALARGGAFTAKADDGTALQYNIAGLARQRGTRLTFDSNIVFNTMEFTRDGVYNDAGKPWNGQPYAKASENGSPFYAPFLGLSTDFEKLDHWTFAFGVFGPAAYGHPSFPLTNPDGSFGAQGYDLIKADLLVVYPTLAAAYRVTRWLDLGVALHLVVAHLQLSNLAWATVLGENSAGHAGAVNIDASGITATFGFGAMFHPLPQLSFGLNLRGPVYIDATGTASASAPPFSSLGPLIGDNASSPARFKTQLPWTLRLGARYAFLNHGFEQGDIEVDATYEAWGDAQQIDAVSIDQLTLYQNINSVIVHHYKDTFSVRIGGAYNIKLPLGVLSLRGGFYYDSPATDDAYTRVDFNTIEKFAPTFGLGYQVRGVHFKLAYAYVIQPDRAVTVGQVPVTAADGTATSEIANAGFYRANLQIFSFGVTIHWEDLLKKPRTIRYN